MTTIPGGTAISGHETWVSGETYVVSGVTVPAGATLTIEPGAVIKAAAWTSPLTVDGGTLVVGAAGEEQAVITAYHDDTAGGDTVLDGGLYTPSPGFWSSIRVLSGEAVFRNVSIRYGGEGGIHGKGAVYNAGGTLSISDSVLSDDMVGVHAAGGTTEIRGTSFSGNGSYAIRAVGGTVRTGGNRFLPGNGAAIYVQDPGTAFENEGGNTGEGSISFQSVSAESVSALPADGLPYELISPIVVPAGASLTIGPGAVLKPVSSAIHVSGTAHIGELGGAPVIFTSVHDDTAGGDTGRDGSQEAPERGDWSAAVVVEEGGTVEIRNADIRYGGFSSGMVVNHGGSISLDGVRLREGVEELIHNQSGAFFASDSEFSHAYRGIWMGGGTVEVHGSSMHDISDYAAIGAAAVPMEAQGNWWGDASGPWHLSHQSGLGERLNGSINFDPWKTCFRDTCHSSVLFLPGIMGSRLYDDKNSSCIAEKIDPKRAWEPSCNDDVRKLYLDSDGKSLDPDIHVKNSDILDEVSIGGANIYKSFIEDMDEMAYTDHLIKDWKPVAYDWRLSLDDILADGSIESVLRDLARNSNTGKVTIVAHSNGGLLAKALMKKIGDNDTENLVDKVVFVAVPQVGTPMAIAAALHGYKQSHFPVLDTETARNLAENMPVAYNLLPSEAYFSGVGSNVRTPVVTFESGDQTSVFRNEYGNKIDNYDELESFLLGLEARRDPTTDNVKYPISLVSGLLSAAKDAHGGIDNNWSPPSGVSLYEIAGWGEETLAGLNYKQGSFWHCFGVDPCIDFDPVIVEDGDGTVVTPSALAMSESFPNVKRFWLNLNKYNGNHSDETHSTIFEVSELRTFIKDLISGIFSDSFAYITTSVPDPIDVKKRLRYYLHSPLTLELYDEQGNHFGYADDGGFDKQIPSARYQEFGDVKFASVPADLPVKLIMNGQGDGGFDLKIEEARGNEVFAATTFANIPSLSHTKISMDFPDGTIEHADPLVIDYDGNGETDLSLEPKIGEVVTTEPSDTVAPTTALSLSGTQGTNGWYTSDVTVTLTATDDGSVVEKTEYSLDGASWTAYADPFTISIEGTTILQYRSIDKAGNQEETKTETVRIDKTAPEAKISFNPTTQKLDISGMDNLSDVSAIILEKLELSTSNKKVKKIKGWFEKWHGRHKKDLPDMLAAITDEAGHTTSLSFEKRESRGSVFVRLLSIGYDGEEASILKGASISYAWHLDKRGRYTDFSSSMMTEDSRLMSVYLQGQDRTLILEQTKRHLPELTNEEGMAVPYMESQRGEIGIKY